MPLWPHLLSLLYLLQPHKLPSGCVSNTSCMILPTTGPLHLQPPCQSALPPDICMSPTLPSLGVLSKYYQRSKASWENRWHPPVRTSWREFNKILLQKVDRVWRNQKWWWVTLGLIKASIVTIPRLERARKGRCSWSWVGCMKRLLIGDEAFGWGMLTSVVFCPPVSWRCFSSAMTKRKAEGKRTMLFTDVSPPGAGRE